MPYGPNDFDLRGQSLSGLPPDPPGTFDLCAAAREEGRREVLDAITRRADREAQIYRDMAHGRTPFAPEGAVVHDYASDVLYEIVSDFDALPAEEAQPHCPRCGRETAIAALCPLCYPPAEEAQHDS